MFTRRRRTRMTALRARLSKMTDAQLRDIGMDRADLCDLPTFARRIG